MDGQIQRCYVDDSIHENLGFVALSFVFSGIDLDLQVQSALKSAGLDPIRQEYKSGFRMDGNLVMQSARRALMRIVREHCRVAVVFALRDHRISLGKQCLQALQSILIRNGISPNYLHVYVDEGIFSSDRQAFDTKKKFNFLSPILLFSSEKSHVCRGIQIADLVAHSFSQVVRDGISVSPRKIYVGGNECGYEEPTSLPLSEFILSDFRYSILRRSLVREGSEFDPATDPLIFESEEDALEYGIYPETLGWGIQISQKAPDSVRDAVSKMLSRIWLGCMH